jgi:tetraprenyl-beta-curcumene synthase
MSSALGAAQTVRAGTALLLANARYWSSVAPLARRQLARWERRARAIPDPLLAHAALTNLGAERFNAELAATLATLAPRALRARTVAAIVALQIAYDYLDTLTEQPAAGALLADPLGDGRRLHQALLDAVAPAAEIRGDYYDDLAHANDGGYLRALVDTVRGALGGLPAAAAVAPAARNAAARCAEAQVRAHAAARVGDAELERWAKREAAHLPVEVGRAGPSGNGDGAEHGMLEWPEFLAGAQGSVLTLHALIAAAADPCTSSRDAERIDAAYLRIAALSMLDSLIDSEQDAASGQPGYAHRYDNPEQLAQRLGEMAHEAARRADGLAHSGHHTMTLAGVVAFYASDPAASSPLARPAIARVRGELRPLLAATLAIMRIWRAGKLLHEAGWVVSSR